MERECVGVVCVGLSVCGFVCVWVCVCVGLSGRGFGAWDRRETSHCTGRVPSYPSVRPTMDPTFHPAVASGWGREEREGPIIEREKREKERREAMGDSDC